MSLMKRMLSSIGIGSTRVDTVLLGDHFAPGDTLQATVRISGGEVEQWIDGIYFSVHCSYEVGTDEGRDTRTALLGTFKLADAFAIAPAEEKQLPVAIELPWETPLTLGTTRVWLQTGLDIKQAVDPGDQDYIRVVPNRLVGALFEALERLGFRLAQIECEPVPSGFRGGRAGKPFLQEFEFKPRGGPFSGRLDELELVCLPGADRVEVLLEIDRKARGLGGFLAEMMNVDESRVRFVFGPDDLAELPERLRAFIGRRA